MTLDEVIHQRRSVRRFKQIDVADQVLEEIIMLSRKCPSAGAIRGFKAFITREKLVYDAPVYIVICCDPSLYETRYGDRGKNLYAIQDATIFGTYIMLLLVDRGLASVWVGAFREGKVQHLLGTTMRPIAILAVGYKEE